MSTYRKHKHSGVRPKKQPDTWIIDYIDHNGKRKQKSYHGTESEAVKVRRRPASSTLTLRLLTSLVVLRRSWYRII